MHKRGLEQNSEGKKIFSPIHRKTNTERSILTLQNVHVDYLQIT